jgi:hypothetical protein
MIPALGHRTPDAKEIYQLTPVQSGFKDPLHAKAQSKRKEFLLAPRCDLAPSREPARCFITPLTLLTLWNF